MAEYLGEQRLSVNQDKTHLLLLTTTQRRRHIHNEITVRTEKEIIKPTETERLLGIRLEQNMGFGRHIDNLIHKLKVNKQPLTIIELFNNIDKDTRHLII